MRQAPQELQDLFEDDCAAMAVLQEHYTVDRSGIMRPKDAGRNFQGLEDAAINYLILEWDYGYRGA